MAELHDVSEVVEVFTPASLANRNFLHRPPYEAQIVDVLRTPGRQLLLVGPPDSGKSSLIERALRQLYEDHVVTFCSRSDTLQTLIEKALDSMQPMQAREVKRSRLRERRLGHKVGIGVAGTSGHEVVEERIRPLPMTLDTLLKVLGEREYPWLVEDMHLLRADAQDEVFEMCRAFSDAARRWTASKLILTASSRGRPTRISRRQSSPMVYRLDVGQFSSEEMRSVAINGCLLLNLELGVLADRLMEACGWNIRLVHQACLELCNHLGVSVTLPTRLALDDEEIEIWLSNVANMLPRQKDQRALPPSQ